MMDPKTLAALKEEEAHHEHEQVQDDNHVGGETALKFLLAGGVAGASARVFVSLRGVRKAYTLWVFEISFTNCDGTL